MQLQCLLGMAFRSEPLLAELGLTYLGAANLRPARGAAYASDASDASERERSLRSGFMPLGMRGCFLMTGWVQGSPLQGHWMPGPFSSGRNMLKKPAFALLQRKTKVGC